jgi:hypothetical protein
MMYLQPPEDYPPKSVLGSAKWERPKVMLVVDHGRMVGDVAALTREVGGKDED